MPIVKRGTSSNGTPPPASPAEVGYASVTYIDPRGNRWPLTDTREQQWTPADGVSGLGAAPYSLTSDQHPRGGARLRHVQPLARTITWPLLVIGDDHASFVARWRELARAFTDTLRLGPGILEFQRPDGSRRQIEVLYEEGFDVSGAAYSGMTWDTAVLSLWCEDPYWYNPATLTVHREHSVGEDYLAPFPSVSSGQVLGATTVTNPGDIVVWPTWTITGPASLITFTHADSGDSFVFDPTPVHGGPLLAGESMTVRTDPVQVRYQDGTNWVGGLNFPGAVLWGLEPGDNAVTFQLDGSGPGSAVDLSFNARYETV